MSVRVKSVKEMLRAVYDGLMAVSDKQQFDYIMSNRDVYCQYVEVKRQIDKIIPQSDFAYANGFLYLFTGEIYEVVSRQLFCMAVDEWLLGMGVNGRAFANYSKKLEKNAFDAIVVYKPFEPKFHVKAYTNGVVDFTKGVLMPFGPEHHVMYKHPYRYDPSARCPMWQQFLRTVLPEKESRLILQMYLGLCTYDRGRMVDKVENCLMLYGAGSNGKGVISDTITGLFGRDNVSTMGLLSLIKGGDERLRNVARIDGKLVNMCPEIQARDISGYEDAFKTICSGEMVYGRNIGGNVYEVRNVPWLIFSMNNLPKASDTSYGYFRRFLYVIFENVIPEDMQNKHLAEDLKSEYPGILNWVIRGGKYLKQRKFVFPKSENSEKNMLNVIGNSDVTQSWARARGVRASAEAKGELHNWIRVTDLYGDMCKYAEANNFEVVDIKKFGTTLKNVFGFGSLNKRRDAKGVLYKVYGCSQQELDETPVPLVNDMMMDFEEYNSGVDYDEEDI